MRHDIFEGLKEFSVTMAAYLGVFILSFALVGAVELFIKLFE